MNQFTGTCGAISQESACKVNAIVGGCEDGVNTL